MFVLLLSHSKIFFVLIFVNFYSSVIVIVFWQTAGKKHLVMQMSPKLCGLDLELLQKSWLPLGILAVHISGVPIPYTMLTIPNFFMIPFCLVVFIASATYIHDNTV